ncbi:MAG: hypothetical protein JXA64_12075 [Candidatus Fermentibacteraceae bacterium]|nr:hypothetical protein [Candidatus Fermentibacteraceae bacterium]MBN2609836.1 hypothetical protein [Candidatus Fermentibacteraceae bacterium]
MIHILSAVLCVSLTGGFLEEADGQFRTEVLQIMPEEFGSVGTGVLMEEAAGIAGVVYSSHAGDLRILAAEMLSGLPSAGTSLLDGLTLRDSEDMEAEGIMEILAAQGGGDLDGYLYLLRFWDPAIAAGYTKSLFLARSIPTSEYGGRTLAERIAPDLYFHLDGNRPIVAIMSLRDVFTVEMVLDDSGCYLPVMVSWYER